MDASTSTASGIAATAPAIVPAQRSSDAFTAYASVHELGTALQRAAHADDAAATAD